MKYQDAPFYQNLDFETIFGYTWDIYKRNFGWLFFFSFIGVLLIQVVIYSFFSDSINQLMQLAENPQGYAGPVIGNVFFMMGVMFLVYTLLYLFLFYWIIGKTLTPEKNHFVLFTEAVRKYYLPYLLLMFLEFAILTVGVMVGILAFVIGSLFAAMFLGTVFFPTTPMIIIENLSPGKVISRAFRFVLKDFWRVLGFVVVFYVIIILFSMIFSAVSMAPYAGKFVQTITGAAESGAMNETSNLLGMGQNPVYIILNSLFNALLFPLTPIFSVLVYFHLKFLEDQENSEQSGSIV